MSFSLTVENKVYNFTAFTGKVAERNESTVTNFHTKSTHSTNRYGSSSSTSVSSTNTKYTEFYLVNDQGGEKVITLKDSNLKMRAGHEVTVIWVNDGVQVAAHNKNLNQTVWIANNLFPLHNLSAVVILALVSFLPVFIVTAFLTMWLLPEILSYILALICCIGFDFIIYKRHLSDKVAKPAFEKAVYDYIDQL